MFWIILTASLALLGGLYGFNLDGSPAALAFTIAGAFAAIGIRDLSRHRHAIVATTVILFTLGFHYLSLEAATILAFLGFSLQLSLNEFLQRKSTFLPVAMSNSVAAWWMGWHYMSPMAGLIFALLSFLVQVSIHDYIIQRNHAIRRNFPLIGWFRYGFELIGAELRQYWFMSDTEETPYNRLTRQYVYRSAKGKDNNQAFGTQRKYRDVSEIHVKPAMFPIPDTTCLGNRLPPLVIGYKRRKPYVCPWPINISGMSWGALSAEAVQALSSGAKVANIHMLTGEGGLTPYHLNGVTKRPPAKALLRWRLRKVISIFTCGLVKAGEKPKGKVVGGGRIIVQLGPAKFGFRKNVTRAVAEKLLRGIYALAGNAPDEPFTMLDIEKLKEVCKSDQIVGIELKLAQGAKPGQGGKLPKAKITPEVAEWRGIPMGEDCYSPNAWDEFHDVPSLFTFLTWLQEEVGKPVGIKIVVGHDEALHELAKRMKDTGQGPDFITVDGGEGGTGSAPVSLADRMGMPLLHAIPKVDNILREHGVRDETVIIASGQIAKGDDVAIAIAMGADMVNIGRGNLLAEGCIMSMKCHTNNCPTGITTQDIRLRRGLDPQDKYVKVANYNMVLQRELLMFMKSAGVRTPWELTRKHLSVVMQPMVEQAMDSIHPYPDGSDGKRNPVLAPLPQDDPERTDRFGPKLIKIVAIN
jgi:glutamate synthase domain-containing protein 2